MRNREPFLLELLSSVLQNESRERCDAMMDLEFEELTHENYPDAFSIERDDIPEAFVDTASTIMSITDYGVTHHCTGHAFVVKCHGKPVALILLGEALPWPTDPSEMRAELFYRLMGFVVDRKYRSLGIGGEILERTIELVYRDCGRRPIALGCHKDNTRAERFYLRHGFRKTEIMEGNDCYYLRFPEETKIIE